MPSEPAAQHSHEQPQRTDVAADAALVLAALGRMEAAIRDERAAMERLRLGLGELARAIAQGKAGTAPDRAIDSAALLDEFEHLVDAMIEIAGGVRPAKLEAALPAEAEPEAAAAESDQVPTVFNVVSRLGADAVEETQAADFTAVDAPTVAMLKAMVEALNASVPEAAEPAAVEEAPEPSVAMAAEPAVLAEEPQPVAESVENVADAPPPQTLAPVGTMPHEIHLLANLERMETVPIPPPEIGTAVIFGPRIEEAKSAEPEPAPIANPEPEPAPIADPEPELHARIERDPDTLPALELPPEWFDADFSIEAAASPEPQRLAFEPNAEFDPEEFLFGAEPEPEPAAFLLEPPQPKPAPPSPIEPVEAAPVPEPQAAAPADSAEPEQPAQPQPPPDPLGALKAMSAEERLALFS